MSANATAVRAEHVYAVLEGVPDPEMPPVSVAELGMVVDVRVGDAAGGARVEVDLVATFSGCPAIDVIRSDVAGAVRAMDGVSEVDVRFVRHVTWTPDRISDSAHDKLRAFGIAPPGGGPVGALPQVGATALPLFGGMPTACPLCGSRDTVMDSPFGPTPCRSTHYCQGCRNPFEAVKD